MTCKTSAPSFEIVKSKKIPLGLNFQRSELPGSSPLVVPVGRALILGVRQPESGLITPSFYLSNVNVVSLFETQILEFVLLE